MATQTFKLREKILTMGAPGTGKTYAWLSIAKRYPKVQFYAIDTDDSVPRMLSGERFGGLENVHCLPVTSWKELVEQTAVAIEAAERGDWIIVDRFDKPWEFVQSYFGEEIYGKDPGAYIMQRRRELANKKTPADRPALVGEFGVGDWVTMGKLFGTWFRSLNYSSPAHIFATTPPKSISSYDSKEVTALFSAFGIRPGGRKEMAHEFQTVLIMTYSRHGSHKENGDEVSGSWHLTTVKDRERPMLDGEELKDFGLQYIRKIAKVK